jgi:hypothetical protein
MWKNREFSHYSEKQRRFGIRNTNTQSSTTDDFKVTESELDKQIEELIGGEDQEVVARADEGFNNVNASQVELYEINEHSMLNAEVYPLSFRCKKQTCGHYKIINPRGPIDLTCPCCKEAWCFNCNRDVKFIGGRCVICSNSVKRNEMYQFSSVFACPRCAEVEELTPKTVKLKEIQGVNIPCQNTDRQCKGHMHFLMFGTFQNSYWKCESCGYKLTLEKHCKCHIGRVEDQGLQAKSSIMKPFPTSASSLASPLIKSYLYMGTGTITLESLKKEHDKSKSVDESWNLDEEVANISSLIIKEKYGILNAFTVPKITTLIVVYGFISGIQSYPTKISENERLAQFFKPRHSDKYHAYSVKTVGRGLVIILDKKKILQILKNAGLSNHDEYDELVDSTKSRLDSQPFQKIIANTSGMPLISLLHSIEHAFIKSLMNQTGLEDFGSKVMLDDCCIVLFEREDLASGGLLQLTKGKGAEFMKFLRNSESSLKSCSQLCEEACIACIFINDFYCQPYLPTEVSRWFPPNSLLNRKLGRDYFDVKTRV